MSDKAAQILIQLARNASHVERLTKENYPHQRNPEWVFQYPDTEMKRAMNDLMDSIHQAQIHLSL